MQIYNYCTNTQTFTYQRFKALTSLISTYEYWGFLIFDK